MLLACGRTQLLFGLLCDAAMLCNTVCQETLVEDYKRSVVSRTAADDNVGIFSGLMLLVG